MGTRATVRRTHMTSSTPVGLIGVGLLGQALARRLLDAQFDVIGFDIAADRRSALEQAGGRAAAGIADVAQVAAPILIAVFDTAQVEEVVETGLLPALGDGSGRIVMCVSTCDPDRIAALADRVQRRGLRFLETPVSGTSEQVRRGDGVGLIGGDPVLAAEVAPVLDAIFPRRFHVGRIGDGGRAKLAVNLILGLNRLALAEGLVFAERLGLDPAAFLKIAVGSAAYSQVMETKGRKMVEADFAPEGRVRQSLKDFRLMLEQAARVGQSLPVAEVNVDVLASCLRHDEGELDNSAVVAEIRRRTSQQ